MKKYKLLILTDHTNHSKENALYALAKAMRQHESCESVDVASRGNVANAPFFTTFQNTALTVCSVKDDFQFTPSGKHFFENSRPEKVDSYDAVWLRLPPPLTKPFLDFLDDEFPNQLIINDPKGIWETGSKEFLINFPDLCPEMQICDSVEKIKTFKNRFPIVLKPFREYGGRGIVRIDGEKVWEGKKETNFSTFIDSIQNMDFAYLGVEFLENVGKGDKRIVVVDGEIMGASLRLPAEGSWLCNVAAGGSSNPSKPNEIEKKMVAALTPTLREMGIVMYGVDTLVGNDGKRILSEINTTSIGGLPQIAQLRNEPLVEKAADLLWNYIRLYE